MRFSTLFCTLLVTAFGVFYSGTVHAQTPTTLLVNPQFPQAGESYTVSVPSTDPFVKIVWYRDGKVAQEFANTKTITLKAKGVGVSERITATLTSNNGNSTQVSRTITPVRTDIIVSADTLVPTFYKGRKLGSSGSTMTATALVFQGRPKETGALTYLWSIGSKVQNGGAPSRENSITFSSNFENEVIVGVKIYKNGLQINEKSITVPIVEPEMYFYEKNPLRGLSKIALKNPSLFIGEELLLRAEAYFIDTDLARDEIIRTWKINNQKVSGNTTDPYELTLEKKGSGVAQVSFSLLNMAKLLQGVSGSIGVQF
jgi:hypothetical protein